MKNSIMALLVAFAFTGAHQISRAEETVGEKAAEAGRDLKKTAKKTGRTIQDKTCVMVNGKMECAAKKLKHKTQNAVDEIKDKADDITH